MNSKYSMLAGLALSACAPTNTLEKLKIDGEISAEQASAVQKEADAFISDCKALETDEKSSNIMERAVAIELERLKKDLEIVQKEIELSYESGKALHPEICGGNKNSGGYVSCLVSEERSIAETMLALKGEYRSDYGDEMYRGRLCENVDGSWIGQGCPSKEAMKSAEAEQIATEARVHTHEGKANEILGPDCKLQTEWICEEAVRSYGVVRVPIVGNPNFDDSTVLVECK